MYQAPLNDMLFVLRELAGLRQLASLPGFEDATDDTVAAILEESAKFTAEVLAPLNRDGDLQPSSIRDGKVTTSPGFKDAFRQFAEGGWQGLQHPQAFGGQGLPKTVATPCIEMLNSANLSFALCPLLTDGAIEALLTAGSDTLRERFIGPMIEGRWTGTMNLTEPQAGSDLSLVRSRAEPQGDGSYRVFGQKIFITYGEHDMAENIAHLVLARVPGAPEGVKGISLFLVPKVLVNDDGSLGKRNDVLCTSIEHKLGIKASPTAVLVFGDDKGEVGAGAIGHLIGEENRGLEYMFVMMNAARCAVGVQGVAIAERAYQQAVAYARERVQSRAVEGSSAAVAIIQHPDVRRMLMTMRALTEGARALAYVAAAAHDAAEADPDQDAAKQNRAAYEFLVPLVKGFSTEMSQEVTSLGVQVHGGMGFIEETGAAQHYRDARIAPIYEGTNGIQAGDLVGRKLSQDGGESARVLIADMKAVLPDLARLLPGKPVERLAAGIEAVEDATFWLLDRKAEADSGADVLAGADAYLKLMGDVVGGWLLARGALAAEARMAEADADQAWLKSKIDLYEAYAANVLGHCSSRLAAVGQGGDLLKRLGGEVLSA